MRTDIYLGDTGRNDTLDSSNVAALLLLLLLLLLLKAMKHAIKAVRRTEQVLSTGGIENDLPS